MQPQSPSDYKQLLTDVIKKQIVILGPDITLSKARNVKGLTVADDGTVTDVSGAPQEVIQSLIDQFVQLSGLIVKKTMEPLLLLNAQQTAPTSQIPAATSQIAASPRNDTPSVPSVNPSVSSVLPAPSATPAPAAPAVEPSVAQQDPALQSVIDQALSQPMPATPPAPSATPAPAAPASPTEVTPAKNPLAA